ncbi:hypothetical protein HW555_005176 [Spodoptera exigua]|uniref:Uncharacterized protein n=1 Tax=Spodoptera exigua TaxID=7107 RepID=A0A835GK74_SPOEX|nr:hypothetical protein HW555_005176 [Spodoptera exigua]
MTNLSLNNAGGRTAGFRDLELPFRMKIGFPQRRANGVAYLERRERRAQNNDATTEGSFKLSNLIMTAFTSVTKIDDVCLSHKSSVLSTKLSQGKGWRNSCNNEQYQ